MNKSLPNSFVAVLIRSYNRLPSVLEIIDACLQLVKRPNQPVQSRNLARVYRRCLNILLEFLKFPYALFRVLAALRPAWSGRLDDVRPKDA